MASVQGPPLPGLESAASKGKSVPEHLSPDHAHRCVGYDISAPANLHRPPWKTATLVLIHELEL